MKRLGLARDPGDDLAQVVAAAGWIPVPCFPTRLEPTGSPAPGSAQAALVLSPAGARAADLPAGMPALVTGEATARALPGREVLVAPEPRAESLWELLRARWPEGGDFLLVRGERSRGWLEEAAAGTPWRLLPWITHQERPCDPPPDLSGLDAVLALGPLQAEVLAPRLGPLAAFAWGERTARAFEAAGHPATAWCEPRREALGRMLTLHA